MVTSSIPSVTWSGGGSSGARAIADTTVVREFRKLCQAEWAASQGITQITTEKDETNRPALAVNERLGYRPTAFVYSYAREPL
jgi:hypothetical protein